MNREVDKNTLVKNLDAALNVYMNAVNDAPCGGNPIHLTRGSTSEHSTELQEK